MFAVQIVILIHAVNK